MKKNLVVYLLAVLQITSLFAQNNDLLFYEDSFDNLQKKAKNEGKAFFVTFVTASCEPCDEMRQQTFSDHSFIEYVQTYYLAYEVQVDGFRSDDLALAQQYQIMFYPTIMIFDPDGEVLHKFTGFKDAKTFIKDLHKYEYQPLIEEAVIKQSEDIIYSNLDLAKSSSNDFPPPINDYTSDSHIADEAKDKKEPTFVQKVNLIKPSSPSVGSKKEGLFRISVSEQSSEGYGLQLGVYKEYENVLKEVQRLEAEGHKEVLVNVGKLMGKAVFKVAIGPFDSKNEADSYRRNMENKEDRKGFVVELSRYTK